MGVLIEGRFGSQAPVWVTKKQLAQHHEVRRSTRWLEQRTAEGLPSRVGEGDRREYPLGEALDWIAAYAARKPRGGNSGAGADPPETRSSDLDDQADESDREDADEDQPPDAAA